MSIQQIKDVKDSHQKELTVKQQDQFNQHMIHNATLATNDFGSEHFNLENALQQTKEGLASLNAKNGLQSMLAAQMLSIHHLQQRAMTFANASGNIKLEQYYTNSAIKLSNCFMRQANILAKLQGIAGQKIVVERVDVHQGGQAIVGNIQGGAG